MQIFDINTIPVGSLFTASEDRVYRLPLPNVLAGRGYSALFITSKTIEFFTVGVQAKATPYAMELFLRNIDENVICAAEDLEQFVEESTEDSLTIYAQSALGFKKNPYPLSVRVDKNGYIRAINYLSKEVAAALISGGKLHITPQLLNDSSRIRKARAAMRKENSINAISNNVTYDARYDYYVFHLGHSSVVEESGMGDGWLFISDFSLCRFNNESTTEAHVALFNKHFVDFGERVIYCEPSKQGRYLLYAFCGGLERRLYYYVVVGEGPLRGHIVGFYPCTKAVTLNRLRLSGAITDEDVSNNTPMFDEEGVRIEATEVRTEMVPVSNPLERAYPGRDINIFKSVDDVRDIDTSSERLFLGQSEKAFELGLLNGEIYMSVFTVKKLFFRRVRFFEEGALKFLQEMPEHVVAAEFGDPTLGDSIYLYANAPDGCAMPNSLWRFIVYRSGRFASNVITAYPCNPSTVIELLHRGLIEPKDARIVSYTEYGMSKLTGGIPFGRGVYDEDADS